jgi:sec-independent protein translocase protein TatA
MPNIGIPELIVILLILVLVFGASRLPALGEGMGKAIRSFKRGIAHDDKIEVSDVADAHRKQPAKPEPPAAAGAQRAPEPKRVGPQSSASADAITDAEIIDDKKV